MARILFVMHYPGYLRYYDSTVRSLAERGHAVHITFDSPGKQAEGLAALKDAPARVEVLGATPQRRDTWTLLAAAIRTGMDFARYLHPRYAEASYLRDRMQTQLSFFLKPLGWVRSLPVPVVNALLKLFLWLEKSLPVSAAIREFLIQLRPDLVLVTPLVTDGSTQVDLVKAAKALGIPTGLCVASWDHLTTKGLIRLQPDKIFVWNEAQKAEALAYHDAKADQIAVTGAQPFDKWFGRQPSRDRRAFCERAGLDHGKPFLLFVGSTASISEPAAEVDFVTRWVRAVRAADPRLKDMGILIRPHPYNPGLWAETDLGEFRNVAVWPKAGANPVDEGDRADYFDSFFHCAAVVGINTSAMIEAAIVGRPVFTILPEEFSDTQSGTLHFHYMLPENGGFLAVAKALDEHVGQLLRVIEEPEQAQIRIRRFVETFIRPRGLDHDCTPFLAEEIERLTAFGGCPAPRPFYAFPVRALLWPVAVAMTGWRRMMRPKKKKAPKVRSTVVPGRGPEFVLEKNRVQ